MRKLGDMTKVALSRWWLAGAVYFFIAFGTPLGSHVSAMDLVFVLGSAMGLLTVFVFDPVTYRMFNIRRRGKIINDAYVTRKLPRRIASGILMVAKCIFTVILVAATYQAVNVLVAIARDLPQETVSWKGEPFLFATLYTLYYQAEDSLEDRVLEFWEGRSHD